MSDVTEIYFVAENQHKSPLVARTTWRDNTLVAAEEVPSAPVEEAVIIPILKRELLRMMQRRAPYDAPWNQVGVE